jgi:hypothetical protein
MRRPFICFSILLTLLFVVCNDAIAQMAQSASTAPTVLSKRDLRKQDRNECNKQAVQQNIAKRNQAEIVRECMADRQASRKASKK